MWVQLRFTTCLPSSSSSPPRLLLFLQSFAGLCGALLIAGGLCGAFVSGLIVDKTKKFEEIVKVSLSGGAICGCIFAVVRSSTE